MDGIPVPHTILGLVRLRELNISGVRAILGIWAAGVGKDPPLSKRVLL